MLLAFGRRGHAISCAARVSRAASFLSGTRPMDELVKKSDDEELIECAPFRAVRVPPASGSTARSTPIVLVHGVYHGSWFYRGVQDVLAEEGFESFALDLLTSNSSSTCESLAADLDTAMRLLPLRARPVLAGHSQGGLLTQKYMADMDGRMPDEKRVCAVGLIATGSLGHFANSMRSALNCLKVVGGGAGVRPWLNNVLLKGEEKRHAEDSFNATMQVFCLPDSVTTTNCTGIGITMEEYHELMCASPGGQHGDGWPTASHMIVEARPPPIQVPSLSVHFERDEAYAGHHSQWHAEHYGSDILEVPGQPHCWVAPGWEESFARPFARWVAEKV